MRGLTKPSDSAHFQDQCTAGLYKIAIFVPAGPEIFVLASVNT